MKHLSVLAYPAGLKKFQVSVRLDQGAPVPSMLDEGVVYRHPASSFEAVVWATDVDDVLAVLQYHYPSRLSAYTVEKHL